MSELQATRTPGVIVPLPAGGGYQARNAEDLVRAGGALVVDQTTVDEVAGAVVAVLDDADTLSTMAAAESDVDHRLAASIMADEIMGDRDA